MQAAPQAHAAPVARTAHQRPSVITLSRVEFRAACANLMTLAERDGRLVRLSDYLTDGDEVVIDGQRVDSAKVVVLRQQTER